MFLYLLNETEGQAFIELAVQALKISGEEKEYERAELDTYLTELNLSDYQVVDLSFDEASAVFQNSSIPVKRSVIIEICGFFFADKEMDYAKQTWLYALAAKFQLQKKETERLIRWSKDFSDFLKVGLMYINAKQ